MAVMILDSTSDPISPGRRIPVDSIPLEIRAEITQALV
jgi:hypothetical protein